MSKKIAIIGASYLQEPLVRKAKELGLQTICFAWTEGAVCENLVDAFFPISIVEKEQILEICKRERIDGICTIASDVAAPTVAYVADKMGLIANSYESALKANNKYQMREAFVQAGVPCPQYMCVTDTDENTLYDIKSNLQLPIIVKPSDRSGSLGVKKIEDWNGLESAINNAVSCSFKKQAMVEEFIGGREISVEFISYKGIHYPLQITDKVTTEAPHFVELEHHQPSTLSPDMFEKIYAITDKALNALGLTNGASHSEYKITKDGRIAVMEIGGRMGGDFIGSDLVQLSTGYDFVKGVIDVALGCFVEPKKIINKYSGVYFLCEETQMIKHQIEDAILHPNAYKNIYKAEITDITLRTVTCSADRSGYMIYQSDKKIELNL